MARSQSYRDLIVWQKAMTLARKAYSISNELPKSEAFGLLSQIRRAAVSVPSNIAEGHGRLTDSRSDILWEMRGDLFMSCKRRSNWQAISDISMQCWWVN